MKSEYSSYDWRTLNRVRIGVIVGRTIGRIKIVRDNRIINGVDAEQGEFPSQVSNDSLVTVPQDSSSSRARQLAWFLANSVPSNLCTRTVQM
jgi:hypothetical protein